MHSLPITLSFIPLLLVSSSSADPLDNACTTCTDPFSCASHSSACPKDTPFCIRHGNDCICKDNGIGTSGHVVYQFDTAAAPLWDEMQYGVRWIEMPLKGFNCYASTQMWWAGAGGYMGSQFHSDGTQMIDFAIWDHNSTIKNCHPMGNCTRFGGEGEGAHCETVLPLSVNTSYSFKVHQTGANATGVMWGITFTDDASGHTIDGGSLFWDESEVGAGKLGKLRAAALSFQEYYTGGDFNASVAFTAPVGTVREGGDVKHYPATSVSCGENDERHNCSACVPGVGCGPPNVLLQAGDAVPTPTSDWEVWKV